MFYFDLGKKEGELQRPKIVVKLPPHSVGLNLQNINDIDQSMEKGNSQKEGTGKQLAQNLSVEKGREPKPVTTSPLYRNKGTLPCKTNELAKYIRGNPATSMDAQVES